MSRLDDMCAARNTINDSTLPDIVKVAALKEVSIQLHRAYLWCRVDPGLKGDLTHVLSTILGVDADIERLEMAHRNQRTASEIKSKGGVK